MFNTLLESSAAHERHTTGHAFSFVAHIAAITVAVIATHRVVTANEVPTREQLLYVAPPELVRPPDMPLPPKTTTAAPLPKGYQILVAPIDIPDVLPPIDFTKPVTDPANFTGIGKPGGTVDGVPDGVARTIDANTTYLGTQVEKVAAHVPGTGTPDYPESLRNAGFDGTVDVRFVVDSTGRADLSTLAIVRSPHAQFSDAVRKALGRMRFFPAEVSGRKVRQWVEMPFVFSFR